MSWTLNECVRSVLADERGTITKTGATRIAIALVYPNTYRVGMANLGFQWVYRLLNAEPDVVCERAFLPDPADLAEFVRTGSPLVTVESGRPLRDFDAVAFSLSYENDIPNVLRVLDLARIPLLAEQRGFDDPLVLVGGIAASLNPEPIASFMDVVLVGEAEGLIPGFLELLRGERPVASTGRGSRTGSKQTGRTPAGGPAWRNDWLGRAAREIPGAYVPSLYAPVYDPEGCLREIVPRPGSRAPERIRAVLAQGSPGAPARLASSQIRTPRSEFAEMHLIEVQRGCPFGCRFCVACFGYRPPRNADSAERLAEAALPLSEGATIGIVGPSVCHWPGIEEFAAAIVERGGRFSLASMRMDSISERLLDSLCRAGTRTATFAPEAASARLRALINKNLDEEAILETARRTVAAGILHLRLYLMVGLPTETDEDVRAIVDLARKIRHGVLKETAGQKKPCQITVSVSPFVPKPWTPFQWCAMQEEGLLKSRLHGIDRALKSDTGIFVVHELPKWSAIQGLLARGDRRLGTALTSVHENGGDWRRALREVNLNPDFYVLRERGADETFPWEILDRGVPRAFLRGEYERAGRGETSSACAPGCSRCGLC